MSTKKDYKRFARIACLEGLSSKNRGNTELRPASVQRHRPESLHKLEMSLCSLIRFDLCAKILTFCKQKIKLLNNTSCYKGVFIADFTACFPS